MTERISSLIERYAALTDDELQNIAVEGGLADDARELVNQELRRRRIGDVSEYKQYLQHFDQQQITKKRQLLQRKEKSIRFQKRMGFAISIFVTLAGLFALYVQKDEKKGVGMIIAGAILLPLVWIIAWIRRLVWRFLLRP